MTSIAATLAATLEDGGWRAKARPSQLPPSGDWNIWVICSGRGFGKNFAGAGWINELVETRQAGRIGLIAATAADARDVMVEGKSGILNVAPPWCMPTYQPSKRRLEWSNGASALLFSADEPDRLRGPQFDALWADELCAWADPRATWDQAMFGLRLGTHPRALITTTPRPIALLKELLAREGKDVAVTRGSTFENAANLAPTFLAAIRARYENTRLGRQELNAELLSDMPGALWQTEWLERDRVRQAPDMQRIVVAIDPATSNNDNSDETGIIVAGMAADRELFILKDLSGNYDPSTWARVAIGAYEQFSADRIVAEVNQGGQMVEEVIRNVDASVAFKSVHASRGKVTRAEPISALYEQRKVHHVGSHPKLEDQMVNFTTGFDRKRSGYSPDRVDALVWALTELSGNGAYAALIEQARDSSLRWGK